jgi:hypothetical protein
LGTSKRPEIATGDLQNTPLIFFLSSCPQL